MYVYLDNIIVSVQKQLHSCRSCWEYARRENVVQTPNL